MILKSRLKEKLDFFKRFRHSLLIMKFSILLLFGFLMQAKAGSHAQPLVWLRKMCHL